MKLLLEFIQSSYAYREYLWQSISRDMRKRYKRSVLGYFWSMLQPLLMMIILAVVFSNIMRIQIEDYAIFLFCGMLPWSFFSQTATTSLTGIQSNIKIISQIPVPKYIFIVAIAASTFVHFLLSLIPLFLIMIVVGHSISWAILALPLVILPLIIITLGFSLILAVANVFFDDTQHLTGVLLQALYFLSPILYGREHLPEWLVDWVILNPMFSIIEFMRAVIFDGQLPDLQVYFINLVACCAFLLFGLFLFKKTEHKFVYFA